MARPLRLEYPEALYYVSSAGNRGQSVFQSRDDATIWIDLLQWVCERFSCRCFGYCLMPVDYHLVVSTSEPNLSKVIRQLNGVYTQRTNKIHGTRGHVFGGRYKSIVVQEEKYLLPLLAHIFCLPVRAGFVKHPSQFKWSSFKYLHREQQVPDYFDLSWFARDFFSDVNEFEEFLKQNLSGDLLAKVKKQIYLGDDRFIEKVLEKTNRKNRSKEIPRCQSTKPVSVLISDFTRRGHTRNDAIARTYLTGDYTLRQVADSVGVHYSAISKIVSDYEKHVQAEGR